MPDRPPESGWRCNACPFDLVLSTWNPCGIRDEFVGVWNPQRSGRGIDLIALQRVSLRSSSAGGFGALPLRVEPTGDQSAQQSGQEGEESVADTLKMLKVRSGCPIQIQLILNHL
jgi:hypothetical protein